MILAASQTNPYDGNVNTNLENHYQLILKAADNNVDLMVFPELSLTGYVREKAQELAFSLTDSRIEKLRRLSANTKIVLIVGAPILIDQNLFIGSFIIKPDYTLSVYTKQYLHEGENHFFESDFKYNPILELNKYRISFAICADIETQKHVVDASRLGTTLYIPSIFYSKNGINAAHVKLSDYARKYSMNILMANYCGKSYEWDAGGKSGFWNTDGKLISHLNESECGLLIIDLV